jgi:hypothetical protein
MEPFLSIPVRDRPHADRTGASRTVRTRSADVVPAWFERMRPAGNRAIAATLGAVVQRDDPTVEAELLDAAQIADARRYYTSQPWLYTPAIIAQLRTALDLDAEGGVDAALVLAVAKFQKDKGTADPDLLIDGKAGPRTLPRIFRRGLNVEGQGEAFGEAVQTGVIDAWATLATAEERLRKLVEAANERLVASGVPPVGRDFDPDATVKGSFDFPTWRMLVGRTVLDAPALSAEQASDITGTVYHEARHAEQWFRMSQLRAGQGLSAAGIAAEIGIPLEQAQLAAASPLARGSMEALIAQGWWDSFAGPGRAHRERTLVEVLCAVVALRKAKAAAEADPSAENLATVERAQARKDVAYAAYQNLPEENDAFATEHAAAEAITRGTEGTPGEIPKGIGECPDETEAGAPSKEIAPERVEATPTGVPSHDILPDTDLP